MKMINTNMLSMLYESSPLPFSTSQGWLRITLRKKRTAEAHMMATGTAQPILSTIRAMSKVCCSLLKPVRPYTMTPLARPTL